jgi:hypothetical protein
VLTGEPVRGGMGRRRGTVAVEVDHRSRETVRWTVRSTELVEVEMGPKDDRSGPSMWRCLAGEEQEGRLISGRLLTVAQLDAELHSASGKRCTRTWVGNGGTQHGRAAASSVAELTGEMGEGEIGEDFSSQPTCEDKASRR